MSWPRGPWIQPTFAALLSAVAAASLLSGCAGLGAGTGPPSTSTIEAGPGSGFLTASASYLRPLLPGVAITPILAAGDTLVSSHTDDSTFLFVPRPEAVAARAAGNGLIEAYVTHDLDWDFAPGNGSSVVSRLILNQRSGGVLNGDYLLDGTERFVALSAATLADSPEGFFGPTLFLSESSLDTPRSGLAASMEIRTEAIRDLPQFGRFRHGGALILRHSSGNILAIQTETGPAGQSQLWMYAAANATDLTLGRGQLYVLRADRPQFGDDTRYASMAIRNRPLTGRFVGVDNPLGLAVARQPEELDQRAQSAGCLNFVRLGGIARDPDRIDAFYFTDLGWSSPADPSTGRPITANGRLYHIELDPIDFTRVERLEVVLDGDQGDDIYRPDGIASSDDQLLILEDPRARGLNPARVLRYDPVLRRLDPVAVCAERDERGRTLPSGTGGQWRIAGVMETGALFGAGSWLVTVQATTESRTGFRGGGGGQLVLLRVPSARR